MIIMYTEWASHARAAAAPFGPSAIGPAGHRASEPVGLRPGAAAVRDGSVLYWVTPLSRAHYFFLFFHFYLHVLYKYLVLEKNLHIKMYRKGADASTAYTRARRKQRHARTHT